MASSSRSSEGYRYELRKPILIQLREASDIEFMMRVASGEFVDAHPDLRRAVGRLAWLRFRDSYPITAVTPGPRTLANYLAMLETGEQC